MHLSVRKMISEYPDRVCFFAVVATFYPPTSKEYRFIQKAYNTAKEAFREENRDSGVRYFEHLRAVALIVMVYLRVRDYRIIAAALLHDIIEDIPEWDFGRLRLEFGKDVAELVWWVTKPPVRDGESKLERNAKFHVNLSRGPRKAIIVKLADRLHNVITLWDCAEEKRRRKIQETIDFFFPLAEKHIILIHELESAIQELVSAEQTTVSVKK